MGIRNASAFWEAGAHHQHYNQRTRAKLECTSSASNAKQACFEPLQPLLPATASASRACNELPPPPPPPPPAMAAVTRACCARQEECDEPPPVLGPKVTCA